MTKKILSAALAVLMLLVVALPASAAIQATSVEVRGTVSKDLTNNDVGNLTDISTAKWAATEFAGFWYDLKEDKTSETLAITARTDRQIPKASLTYTAKMQTLKFKVASEKTRKVEYGLDITGKTATGTGDEYYAILGWQAEKYVAINGKVNKLAKLVVEQGAADKKTMIIGETWDMGDGYTLTAQSIDAKATPRQAWFVLSKDGVKLDDKVIEAYDSGKTGIQGVYTYYEKSLGGESNVPVFVTFVDSVFAGATSDMVQLKYTWLISKSITEVKSEDKFGVMKVTSTSDPLTLESDSAVDLNKDSTVDIMGNLKFKVADATALRFYPKVDYQIGEVVTPTPGPGTPVPTVIPTNFTPTVTPPVNVTPPVTPPEVTTPTETKPPATPTPKEPGFQAVFAIAGLLAVAYLVLRQKK